MLQWVKRGERIRTSLGACATERSDGAHDDNEGHKGSHGDANDHRNRERFCRERQRDDQIEQKHLTFMLIVNRVGGQRQLRGRRRAVFASL